MPINNNISIILIILMLILGILILKLKNTTNSRFQNKDVRYKYIINEKEYDNVPVNLPVRVKFKNCGHLKLQSVLQDVFDKYKFKKINENSNNWDLYIPCGYNYVETEVKNIKITNPNQKVFAIKGCDKIASKNELWKMVSDFYGHDEASRLIPESFIINNKEDINNFKRKFNKENLYLLKKNIQRKEGIYISNNFNKIMDIITETNKNLKLYYNNINNNKNNLDYYFNKKILHKTENNNNKTINKKITTVKAENYSKNQNINSLINNYKIIQIYINNLYLIGNRKCNLRLYLLVICNKGNKESYLYKYGKCIYTNKEYTNINFENANTEREKHLTSYNLDPVIYETLPESLEDLKNYLGTVKFNNLWNDIIILFVNVMNAVKSKICNSSNLKDIVSFQLFGADIIFTKNLHPYLLELNKGPSMKYITNNDKNMKLNLNEDIFKEVGIIPFKNKEKSNFIKINTNKF